MASFWKQIMHCERCKKPAIYLILLAFYALPCIIFSGEIRSSRINRGSLESNQKMHKIHTYQPKLLRLKRKTNYSYFDRLLVAEGQEVQSGAVLARDVSDFAPLRAPLRAKILKISDDFIDLLPLEAKEGNQELLPEVPKNHLHSWQRIALQAKEAGIYGMGGGGFPLWRKWKKSSFIIVNAIESESLSLSDLMLFTRHQEELQRIFDWCLGFSSTLIFAYKQAYKKPLEQTLKYLRRIGVECLEVAAEDKGQGAESLLLARKFGLSQTKKWQPQELDSILLNLASFFALGQAVLQQQALTHRYLSLANSAPEKIIPLYLPLGTQLDSLLADFGIAQDEHEIYLGSKKTGFQAPEGYGIEASSFLITAYAKNTNGMGARQVVEACINCGACVKSCPVSLEPQVLWRLWEAKIPLLDTAYQPLEECLVCGECSEVCPSNIPLSKTFLTMQDFRKQALLEEEQKHKFREMAEMRVQKIGRKKKSTPLTSSLNEAQKPQGNQQKKTKQSLELQLKALNTALARHQTKQAQGNAEVIESLELQKSKLEADLMKIGK